jgi:DNA-binding NarL/FixJ family response regulator
MNLRHPESRSILGEIPSQREAVAASLDAPHSRQPNQDQKTRVLVVEDNSFVRAGIVTLINRQSDLTCCGEADSIASAPLVMAQKKPDLVLLDLRLKDGEAFELIEKLKGQSPHTPILVLSQGEEALYAEKVLRAGADGYIMKQEAAGELLAAVRTVLHGKIYVSPAMALRLHPDCTRAGTKGLS